MLYNNAIEVLDVSKYSDLELLNISNNNLVFLSDLKLPTGIKHLNLSNNSLKNLDGIENLQELKTLDVRHNALSDNDLAKLSELLNLKVVLVDGNPDISAKLIRRLNNFSSKYISTIKDKDTLDINKHSYLK